MRTIHLPPPVLYWWGSDFDTITKSLAVIGSRNATAYGYRFLDDTIPNLVMNHWTIVSGGARGIDTHAHRMTLDSGGKTIVVLGSGLLSLYPKENTQLFQKVIDCGGIVVTPFASQTAPQSYNFPARNRIIAGLSDGCLVVQAAEKSGARITAEFALEQGKSVFAVPGMYDDPLSAGCHRLIRDDALLTTSADVILTEYGEVSAHIPHTLDMSLKKSSYQILSNSVVSSKNYYIGATESEQKILTACQQEPCTTERLTLMTHLDTQELQATLFSLQIAGVVEQDFAGRWSIVR